MTNHISITLAVPSVSVEKYSELTGLSIDTINAMLADGRLVRHRLRKDKKREKVMINIAATALRGGAAYSHKAGRDLFQVLVPFNTLTFHHVRRFQYQLIFRVHVVTNGDGHAHGKMLDVVKNTLANTGNVNSQIGEVVFFKQEFDLPGLIAEVHALPVNDLQNAEFLCGIHRRGNNHKTRQIAATCRVKASPYWPVTKWPRSVRVVILPGVHLHTAGFQV